MANKKKKEEFGYRIVALHFGYVESGQVSVMILRRQHGESEAMTKAAAVKSVAEFFFKKWLEDHEWTATKLKACCEKAKEKEPDAKFCPKCGKKIEVPGFDDELYTDWLRQQLHATADDWGSYEGEWWPWTSVADAVDCYKNGLKCLEIREKAENVLAFALDADAEWFPEEFREGLRDYQKGVIEHHAENRLYKKGLNIDGLLEADAKSFDELIKEEEDDESEDPDE
jgi:hypothetical protein